MANYKPVTKTLPSTQVSTGAIVTVQVSTTSWGMALVRGTVLYSGTALASGAVEVWESTKLTTATPDHVTFTDANGIFGITCRSNTQLQIKFYGS